MFFVLVMVCLPGSTAFGHEPAVSREQAYAELKPAMPVAKAGGCFANKAMILIFAIHPF